MLLFGNGFRGLISDVIAVEKRESAFLIDETMLQIGSDQARLWVTIEPIHKQILRIYIS
jgi:hypothetical protein